MRYDERTVVARIDHLTLRELRFWVSEGWVRPILGEEGPVFDDMDVARAQLLCELKNDMAISNDGLSVILSLLDRLSRARRDLRRLTEALEDQPEAVRQAVIARFRSLEREAGETDDIA